MVFKVISLDEITQGVSEDEEEVQRLKPGTLALKGNIKEGWEESSREVGRQLGKWGVPEAKRRKC